jgi:anti-anti-sigma factor
MERHLTTSTASSGTRSGGGPPADPPERAHAAPDANTRMRSGRSRPSLVLTSVRTRTHTLVLTGELTYRSAHALEVEIERLCDEGVTGIILDLRQLTCIDSVGVAVISFRRRLCQRQGYGFALIAGSRFIDRAFEQAGLADLLPHRDDDVVARRMHASTPVQQRSRDLVGGES